MTLRNTLIFRTLLFLLGMTAMSTQVILIREALAVFQGNELVIGLFLGIWMMLTAAGSFLAVHWFNLTPFTPRPPVPPLQMERGSGGEVSVLLVSLSLLPLASLFLLVTLRFSLVPPGILPGLEMTALVIFLALLPFCLVSGMLFPVLVEGLSSLKKISLLHEGYALDSAGSVIGGLLFSLVFIFTLPPYESLILLTTFCFLVLFIIWIFSGKIVTAILALVFGAMVFLMPTIPEIVNFLDQKQFNEQKVIEIKSSPFGMLAVSKMGEELFIYDNGVPVSLSDDVFNREEAVHFAMLLHPDPKKVLMVSGGTSGIIGEILKYPLEKADYVDPNPWLLRITDKYRPLPDDQRIRYIYKDPRIYLKNNEEKYDVILVNAPEPNSAELNRFYTAEFFKLLKDKLNQGGLISVATQAAGNYMNETSRLIHSVNYNTLKSMFGHVRIIPGMKDYFLVSDVTIEQSILKHYQDKGINNDYVNPFFINEELLSMRSDLILRDLLPDAPVNSDLKPFVFSLFLRHWLEKFKMNTWTIPLILLLLLILSLFWLGPLNLGLFAGGFTASGLEFTLLIWFQVMYGNVYQMTGVIFALFMAGLAIGSGFRVPGSWFLSNRGKKHNFRGFLMIQGIIAGFSAVIAILLKIIPSGSSGFATSGMILILVLMTGLITGTQFSYSAFLRKTNVLRSSGESFSADLLGSAIGIILVSIYIIPNIGLPMTALSLAGLNVIIISVMAIKNRF